MTNISKTIRLVWLLLPLFFLPRTGQAENVTSALAAAEKAYSAKNYETSRDLYTEILRKDPKNLTALKGRSISALMLGNLQQVCDDMNMYISIDSSNADAFNTRGFARMYSDSVMTSMEDFEKAIALDSAYTEAYVNLATANISVHFDEIAVKLLKKALTIDSNNIMAYRFCGFAYHNLRNFDSAVVYYNKAIAHGYVQPDIYQKIANSYYKANNFEKAIDYYTLVLNLVPNDFDALNNRSMAYANLHLDSLANADRKILDDARNAYLASIDDGYNLTNSKYFSDKSKLFSIYMPAKFKEKIYQDTFSLVHYVTADTITSRGLAFRLGASVEFIDSTAIKLSYGTVPELIGYFKQYTSEALLQFGSAQPFYEKQKQLSDSSLYMVNKSGFTFKSDDTKYIQYLTGFITNNKLAVIRIIFPEELAFKYEQMADDAIKKFIFIPQDNGK